MSRRFGRRAGLFALLAALSACATPPEPEQPVATAPPEDPEPERVYSPGAISWADLSEEHKRRARAGLARIGDPVDDDETLQARWMIMSPAQQRYLIRRPPPPPARPAPSRTTRRGSTTQRSTAPANRQRSATPQRRPPPPPPPRRRPNQQ
ncbi:hypothetical protein KPL78_19750 [Roseomonas sp. HJA6]|uniref:Uncharacterized protein n=1 Tax=Roseomonas alba TaxID=2846776 RepID=A0ABS7AD51_9PROT|nr:hypothetical protein [Neoroseomonas alba]MBW6400103.1 hypothetical protein [Neoroseomonas alba]